MSSAIENPYLLILQLEQQVKSKDAELLICRKEIDRLRTVVGDQNEAIELVQVRDAARVVALGETSHRERTQAKLFQELAEQKKVEDVQASEYGQKAFLATIFATLLFCLDVVLPEQPTHTDQLTAKDGRLIALRCIASNNNLKETVNGMYAHLHNTGGHRLKNSKSVTAAAKLVEWEVGYGIRDKRHPALQLKTHPVVPEEGEFPHLADFQAPTGQTLPSFSLHDKSDLRVAVETRRFVDQSRIQREGARAQDEQGAVESRNGDD